MNYYMARKIEATKKWHFTCMNDGQVWPVGECRNHEGHDTAEEAEKCFYDREITRLKESELVDTQVKCDVCGAWTSKGLESCYLGAASLCDEHRNVEGFKQAVPFRPGIQITVSW